MRDITAALGDADILSVDAIDDATGWVFFTSTLPSEPRQRFLFRARIAAGEPGADGDTSCVERLTPRGAAFAGSHAYRIAPQWVSFIYRYMLCASCSQFDSLPLTCDLTC